VQQAEPCVRTQRHAAAADRAAVLCCCGNCRINNSTDVSTHLIAGTIAGADTRAVRRAAAPARTHALKEQQPH